MLNQANLIGRVGKTVELRYISNGNPCTSFSIATSETWKNKEGTKQEKTTWHNIVIFGKLAEIANQYVKKGDMLYLSGKIENRSYDDKDGNKKYISEIIASEMKMFPRNTDNHHNEQQHPSYENESQAKKDSHLTTDNDLPF